MNRFRDVERRLEDLRAGLGDILGYPPDVVPGMTDRELLETATRVIRELRPLSSGSHQGGEQRGQQQPRPVP